MFYHIFVHLFHIVIHIIHRLFHKKGNFSTCYPQKKWKTGDILWITVYLYTIYACGKRKKTVFYVDYLSKCGKHLCKTYVNKVYEKIYNKILKKLWLYEKNNQKYVFLDKSDRMCGRRRPKLWLFIYGIKKIINVIYWIICWCVNYFYLNKIIYLKSETIHV